MPRLLVNPGTPQQWEIQLKPGQNRLGREFNDPLCPFYVDRLTLLEQHQQIRDARPALLAIVDTLRSAGPVGIQGVAIVAWLLADGAAPIYAPAPPGALAALAGRALEALNQPSATLELTAPA